MQSHTKSYLRCDWGEKESEAEKYVNYGPGGQALRLIWRAGQTCLHRKELAQVEMGRQDDCHIHYLKSLSLTEAFCRSHKDDDKIGWRQGDSVTVCYWQRLCLIIGKDSALRSNMGGDSDDDIEDSLCMYSINSPCCTGIYGLFRSTLL